MREDSPVASRDWSKKLQSVMVVTEPRWPVLATFSLRGNDTKKFFVVVALAFAFTTGTVIAHTDLAIAECTTSNC